MNARRALWVLCAVAAAALVAFAPNTYWLYVIAFNRLKLCS